MYSIKYYIDSFFRELEIFEDINHGRNYKDTIIQTIHEFINDKTTEAALRVYKSFFEAYWIGIQSLDNPFIKLVNEMHYFEANAGKLLDKQRDHFIHSVNVFILGLIVYNSNSCFQDAFREKILNDDYKDSYKTKHEEFFYRWGIASLSHDIAYPMQITLGQARKYIDLLSKYTDSGENSALAIELSIFDFKKFNKLPKLKPKPEKKGKFYKNYPKMRYYFYDNALKILAIDISKKFNLTFKEVMKSFLLFEKKMKTHSFIDHGYYSSLIVMKWYHHLIRTTQWNPAYFYYPIVDIASAILLHNYYKNSLMKKPLNLDKHKVKQHPISFLLILCDELQDWYREGYGISEKSAVMPFDFEIDISNKKLSVLYKFDTDGDYEKYKLNRLEAIVNILDIKEVFVEGITIDAIGGR